MFVTLRRLPSAWLLLVQLVMLISAPILSSNTGTHAFSWALSALALLLVGVVIRNSPAFNAVGFVLVGVALLLSSMVALGHTEWTLWANLVEAAAYFYAAIGMIWYMLDDHVVTRDELFAAAAWLEEHTWLTTKSYRGLDHAVSLDEFSDIRQWLVLHDIASGVL